MTKAEYIRAYRQVRRDGPKITQRAMTELRRTYIDAGELVAKAVRESSLVDASSLDTQSLASIQSQLVKAAELIRDSAEDNSKKAVSSIVGRVGKIDETYLVSAIKSAGSTLSTVKIHNMIVAVNERVVENMTKRLWSDGYTFSTRIWDIGAGFQDDMKRVLSSGIAQGRDPVKIAADIEKYITGGKKVLMKRYGKLEAGTARFVRRIPQNVDYRAMRLVRTELYAALKEADIEAGKVNPGAEDLYDWIMNAGRADWDCDCPEYARNSPYTAANVPTQPHPNCHPSGTMILTPRGSVAIENIKFGDFVVSHDGSIQKVIDKLDREYSGALYTFSTASGEIQATPEHPFLSDGLWVDAHCLKDGDNLTSISGDAEPFFFAELISNNSPSNGFQELCFFEVLIPFLFGVVPIPTIYLNGKFYIWKGEVNGEYSNRVIWDRVFSFFNKGCVQHKLVFGSSCALKTLMSFDNLFVSNDPSPYGLVRGTNGCLEAVLVFPRDTFTESGRLESDMDKVLIDDKPRYAEFFRNFIDSEVFLTEKLDKHIPFNINLSTHSSTIVSVKCQQVNTRVYNMTVEKTHTFIANGFVSHNCGCYIQPRLKDRREFVADLVKWTNGTSVDYLDRWKSEFYDNA